MAQLPASSPRTASGWTTGILWNNTWDCEGTFEKTNSPHLLSTATLPALIVITLLALPALLLLARRPPANVSSRAAATSFVALLSYCSN